MIKLLLNLDGKLKIQRNKRSSRYIACLKRVDRPHKSICDTLCEIGPVCCRYSKQCHVTICLALRLSYYNYFVKIGPETKRN